MDCETNEISCRLEEIALILDEPSWVFWVSIAIPAVAAAGTLWLAVLNMVLLKRQNDVQNDEKRVRRVEYAAALRSWVIQAIADRANGLQSTHSDKAAQEVTRLGALTAEPSQNDLSNFIAAYLEFSLPAPRDRTAMLNAMSNLMELLDEWVEDPKNTKFDLRSAFFGRDPFKKGSE